MILTNLPPSGLSGLGEGIAPFLTNIQATNLGKEPNYVRITYKKTRRMRFTIGLKQIRNRTKSDHYIYDRAGPS